MSQLNPVNRPPGQELIVRESSPPKSQLARLGERFQPAGIGTLLATVINSGDPNVMQVSAALANNRELDSALGQTTAYKHAPPGVTPASDFNALSVGTSVEAAAALSRLTSGFFQARTVLAQIYDESNQELVSAFNVVNGAYALVISTSHKLFDKDASYRQHLRPEFLNLLSTDPYLEKLIPSFANLHDTNSPAAKKIALRTFFENFCDNAVEPYVYNKDFSALIQSILLRELRHVIKEESRLPVKDRILAPYLAKLFETRMRGELETARTKDGKDQPVLDSLRDCPGEGKHLMRAVTDFLIESLGDEDTGIILKHEDLISCEVMLSIGCLLPETELTHLLGTYLRQNDDLSPSLILVFSSALKFSLYVEHSNYVPQEYVSIDPRGLVDFGFKIAGQLSENEGGRLVAEIFLPLVNDFASYANEHLDKWQALPDKIRDACVNKVFIQKVLERERSDNPEPGSGDIPTQELAEILSVHTESKFKLDPVGVRWLVERGALGELTDNQIKRIVKYTVSDGTEAEKLGINPDTYEKLISRGGFDSIQILASRKGTEERLSNQLAIYKPLNDEQALEMRKVFIDRLVDPLRRGLQKYGDLVQSRRNSEMASIKADDKLKELIGSQIRLSQLKVQIPACRGALEEIVDFIKLEEEYANKLIEIEKKKQTLAGLEGLSTKQLVKAGKEGMPDSLKTNIEKLETERDKLLSRRFKLPASLAKEVPDLGRSTMSLGELLRMETERESCALSVGDAEGNLRSAVSGVQESMAGMSERRKEIRRLFSYVQKAAESEAVKGMESDKLALINTGSFDPLGIFCRVNLAAQMTASKPAEEGKEDRLKLEADVRKCLEAAFKDLFSKEDSRLVLTGLAELIERGGRLLSDWEVNKTSLPEFLKLKVAGDVQNDALAWINHEPGWDESMHAPILRIFGALMVSKAVSLETKARAMSVVYGGVCHWVNYEKANRLKVQAGGDASESFVTSEDLYRPWTAVLQLSHGNTKGKVTHLVEVTDYLSVEAMKEVPSASYERLKEIWVPLRTALQSCKKTTGSILNPLPESAQSFCEAVHARLLELSDKEKERKQEIEKAAPEAAVAEGITFSDLKVPGGLALPAPRSQTREAPRLLERRDDS